MEKSKKSCHHTLAAASRPISAEGRVRSMSHIETLIMNEVRKALESLERSGVGYIAYETTGVIHYNIDQKDISISVGESKGE